MSCKQWFLLFLLRSQTPSQEVELTVPLIPLKDNSPTSKHYVEARVAALEKKIEYFTHDVVPYSCLEARDDYGGGCRVVEITECAS